MNCNCRYKNESRKKREGGREKEGEMEAARERDRSWLNEVLWWVATVVSSN